MGDVKPRVWAGVKANGDFICVESYSGYRRCARDPAGRQHLLPPDATDDALGAAVLDALAHSRFLATPEERAALFDYRRIEERYAQWKAALMSRFGYKTKRALFGDMKCCSIESEDGSITICPSNHDSLEGWSGDGIAVSDRVSLPSNAPPADVGAGLRLALDRCI